MQNEVILLNVDNSFSECFFIDCDIRINISVKNGLATENCLTMFLYPHLHILGRGRGAALIKQVEVILGPEIRRHDSQGSIYTFGCMVTPAILQLGIGKQNCMGTALFSPFAQFLFIFGSKQKITRPKDFYIDAGENT